MFIPVPRKVDAFRHRRVNEFEARVSVSRWRFSFIIFLFLSKRALNDIPL